MAHQSTESPIDIQSYLGGVDYPAKKEELVQTARDQGAPDDVAEMIQRLPGDRFESPADVMKAYGKAK